MEFDMRVERKEPWLGHSRDLRRFFQIEEDEPGPIAILFGEIGRFRPQFREN